MKTTGMKIPINFMTFVRIDTVKSSSQEFVIINVALVKIKQFD